MSAVDARTAHLHLAGMQSSNIPASKAPASKTPVIRNESRSRFELEQNGAVAFASYTPGPGVVTVTHTEVPRELREGGIGTKLVIGMLDDIRARGEKLRPLCSFVRHVIAQHPDYADLVADRVT